MSARVKEALKTALIILLLASCLFLAGKTHVIRSVASSLPAFSALSGWISSLRGESTPSGGEPEIYDAASPVAVMVTGLGGHHFGLKYDPDAVSLFYSSASAVLGEALGSSGEPEEISESEWRSMLCSAGIFLDYRAELPLSALAAWYGSDISHSGRESASRFVCICIRGGVVFLCYSSGGAFFRCSTAVSSFGISEIMDAYLPNGALFAFESGFGDTSSPYSVLLSSAHSFRSASSSVPERTSDFTDSLLRAFEMNPHLASTYSEDGGAVVFVEGTDSLRLLADGSAAYSGSSARLGVVSASGEPSIAEMLERARALAQSSAGSFCGAASLRLASIASGYGEYTFVFDYYLAGIRVVLPGGASGVSVTLSGGCVVSAAICFRSYSLLSQSVSLLPDALAFASAAESGEPEVVYFDAGGSIGPVWTLR